jgi:hypothetical protein
MCFESVFKWHGLIFQLNHFIKLIDDYQLNKNTAMAGAFLFSRFLVLIRFVSINER